MFQVRVFIFHVSQCGGVHVWHYLTLVHVCVSEFTPWVVDKLQLFADCKVNDKTHFVHKTKWQIVHIPSGI